MTKVFFISLSLFFILNFPQAQAQTIEEKAVINGSETAQALLKVIQSAQNPSSKDPEILVDHLQTLRNLNPLPTYRMYRHSLYAESHPDVVYKLGLKILFGDSIVGTIYLLVTGGMIWLAPDQPWFAVLGLAPAYNGLKSLKNVIEDVGRLKTDRLKTRRYFQNHLLGLAADAFFRTLIDAGVKLTPQTVQLLRWNLLQGNDEENAFKACRETLALSGFRF